MMLLIAFDFYFYTFLLQSFFEDHQVANFQPLSTESSFAINLNITRLLCRYKVKLSVLKVKNQSLGLVRLSRLLSGTLHCPTKRVCDHRLLTQLPISIPKHRDQWLLTKLPNKMKRHVLFRSLHGLLAQPIPFHQLRVIHGNRLSVRLTRPSSWMG